MPPRQFGFKAPFKEKRKKRKKRKETQAKKERDAIGRFVIHDGLQRYARSSSIGVTSPRPYRAHEVTYVAPPAATQEQNKENCTPVVASCGVLEMATQEQPAGEKKKRKNRSIYRQAQEANKCNIAFVEEVTEEVAGEPEDELRCKVAVSYNHHLCVCVCACVCIHACVWFGVQIFLSFKT